MNDTMLSFGELVFAVPGNAYEELQRSASWRWPSQDRTGGAPARQFVGKGDDTIRLSGSIIDDAAGRPCEPIMDALYAAADAATPRRIAFGNGRTLPDQFVITDLSETHRVFDLGGRARRIDFQISFARYA